MLKMTSRHKNFLENTLTRKALFEIENETAVTQSEKQKRRDLPGRFGGPGLRCQAISFVLIVQSTELA
jgi:hypothetical protein